MDDKVKALMYAAALAPPNGASINDLGAGQPPPPRAEALKPDSGGYLRLGDEGIAKYFAQDLPAKEISVIAATQGPAFSGVFDEKLATAAYETKSSWYVVTKHDGMIPPAAEAAVAKAIGAKVTELSTSHAAMLSKPREVADVILAAAASVK